MDLDSLTKQAKKLVDDRGGVDALKGDAEELKDIVGGRGRTTNGKTIQTGFLVIVKIATPRIIAPMSLGSGGFEEVGATAGAIAYIVAYQIGDHGRRCAGHPREYRLLLYYEYAHIGGLRVNAAPQLSEQRDKAGAKTEAHDLEGNVLEACAVRIVASIQIEDDGHANQAQGDDQKARNRATTERSLDRVI